MLVRKQALVVALAAAWLTSAAWAEKPLDIDVGVNFDTNFNFRGSTRGPAGFVGNLRVAKEVAKGLELEGNAWGYFQADREWGLGEGQYSVAMRYRPPVIGWLGRLEAGYTFYDCTRRLDRIQLAVEDTLGRDTQEWYLRWRLDLPGNPSIDLLQDFDQRVGTYLKLQAAKSIELSGPWAVDLAGSVGFDWGRGIDTWRDLRVHTGVRYDLIQGLGIGASADWFVPSNQVDTYGIRPVVSFGLVYVPKY